MTNSMKVYKAVRDMQDILNSLDTVVDKQYYPASLKKVGSMLSNAEFNLAQVIAQQALHRATSEANP